MPTDNDVRTTDARTTDAPETATVAPHDVIFIDTSVDDYRQLAAEWADRGQVVLIDGTADGIAQMQAALAGQSDIGAIHIVSHGSEGALFLGTTRIDTAAIEGSLAASLGAIGSSLRAGGDILIYGCDFAEGSDGATALAAFAQATHADVAASTDLTGYAPRGGDWVLEAHVGQIEARSLDSSDWVHTLDPNTPVPISVTADSLTVTNGAGTVVVDGTTGYGTDSRSPDVGVGAVAVWHGAATYNGQAVDLRATVVSLSSGDAIRFNRPTGTGANGDDPTFLLRDLTTTNDATVQIRWELVLAGTNTPLPADVRFTISDIDGIGGNPNTRESVSAATTGLAYYTRERISDINFVSSLDTIAASGTQNENTTAGAAITSKSAATFDWSDVSSFTLTYKLTTNALTSQAQFYHDGDADFIYTDPVYVSVPRLDLDGDDSTASGNDAHFTFTENGPAVPIVDSDVVVSNPMDINSITGATVRLTNYQAGDTFTIATLPSNITATIGTVNGGAQTITLSGLGSESDYATAFRAITLSNTSDTPATVQRVIDIAFSNDTLTSATATSRIDVVPVNDPPVAVDDSVTTPEDTVVTIAVLANDSDPENDALTVTSASALHGAVMINANGTLTYMPSPDFNGSDTISYTISDGQGGAASATVAVTVTPVNDAPTRVGTLPARATSDAASVSYNVSSGFTDVDRDTLTYSATGLPAGLAIDAGTGLISGIVDRSASQTGGGSYAVIVTARDPSNASATQTFTIAVSNPAPIAVDDNASTAEDTPVTIAVLGNDSDPDGDPLAVTSATALHGSVTINADNTLRYTPDANYNGADTIRYAISDGQGGTASANVAVTITPVDDAPNAVGTLPARTANDADTISYPTAAAFADVDGDTLSYTATGLPAGLQIDAATGIISGTIDHSASVPNGGHYDVRVTATDPSGSFATQSFALDAANPAPVALDDAVRTHVDTPVTVAVLANDSDPDGDPLNVTSAVATTGSVTINPDGTLRYTPPAGFAGRDSVTYTISDGQGGSATATLTIDIGNAAPTATPIPTTLATDGQSVNLPLASSFNDADGDALSYTATGLPPGLVIDPATGTISGTLAGSASQSNNGDYDTIVTASDGHGGSVSTSFHWTVSDAAPSASNDSATTPEDVPIVIAVLANDSDPNGDPLVIVSAAADHGSVTINPDGTIGYRPAANFNGTDQIRYTISDGKGGQSSAIVTVSVTPVNDAPTNTGLSSRTTGDGVSVSVPVAPSFGDVDGDALSYTATGLPPGLTIDPATGIISGTITPGSDAGGPGADGIYHAIVTATDPSGATSTAPFDWTVSRAAPNAVDDSATTPEDTPVTIPVLANDSDPEGEALTIIDAVATHGTAAIAGDSLVFTPARDFNGIATMTYTASDAAGHHATATVTITVTAVNDAPIAATLPAVSGRDAQPVTLELGGFFSDPDGDVLGFAATGLPPGLSIDSVTGQVSGVVDRSASQNGVYHVTVTATDPSGAATSSSFDWTIVDPAPVARDDAASVAEDAAVSIPVLGNDSDPAGDPLSVVAASASHGSVTIGADGTLLYTPAADFNGNDVIVYTIDDGNGGRASASVLVTVTPVNDAPVALSPAPADPSVADGAVVAIDAGNWFRDPDGDALVYAATGLPAGLSIDPTTGRISGTIDHSASQNAGGLYPVTITATDPSNAVGSTTFTLHVTNPAPVAVDDAARASQDSAGIDIPVLANDSDPDGDPLSVVSAVAAHGSATINPDGSVRYVPGAGFSGSDTITYTISDGDGGTATAHVTIMVDPLDHPPVIAGLAPVDTRGGQPVRIDVRPALSDPDGDPLRITDASVATGTVVVNPDATLTYTPPLGFSGTATVSYTVSDGRGGTTTGTILVRVAPATGDIAQLLRIGRVSFHDPGPAFATVFVADGTIRSPLSLLGSIGDSRALRSTTIGDQPVGDAVAAIRSLRDTDIDPDTPVTNEVARLDGLRDQRDAGDRLFDQRWSDFLVKGLTGFSAANDRNAGVMVDTVVHGGAIYLEVHDTAEENRAAIRSIDVRLASGGRPAWISLDPRGLAIIERGADMDELHLIVRVTRRDGSTSATPILLQGQTGEVELDRKQHATQHISRHAVPLNATLHTPSAALHAEAVRLASLFQ